VARRVRIATVDLDRPDGDPLWLDAGERARAAAFAFERDRRRYVAAHLALRRILAAATGTTPEALRFEAGRWGKPRLAGIADAPAFSLSHSGAVGLVAVADGPTPIGVDVEAIRPVERPIADLVAAPEERAFLDAAPDEAAWTRRFVRLWTLKEAVVKALGTGLALPLPSFAVAPFPTPRLLRPPTMDDWHIVDLAAPPSYAAALASPQPFVVDDRGSATTMT
jgi:4'-phosphopantetheinyl transferase